MLPQDTNLSLVPPAAANDTTKDDSFAKHSFPPDGLVALSRVAYQQTPLSTSEVRRGVFVFAGAGGNITAIDGSQSARSLIADLALVSRRSNALSLPRFRKRHDG